MRQAERQTNIPINLESAIRLVAQVRDLRVGFNTHYDSMNCVISWIEGKILFRLNFQPTTSGSTDVTLYRDRYLFLPKILSWADHYLPYFTFLTPLFRKIDYRVLKALSNGESTDFYTAAIREYIEEAA
jgi:hypothetical protein